MAQNLTEYSSDELSLQVMNDEGLYNMRHSSALFEILDELYIYTEEQRDILEQDLEAE